MGNAILKSKPDTSNAARLKTNHHFSLVWLPSSFCNHWGNCTAAFQMAKSSCHGWDLSCTFKHQISPKACEAQSWNITFLDIFHPRFQNYRNACGSLARWSRGHSGETQVCTWFDLFKAPHRCPIVLRMIQTPSYGTEVSRLFYDLPPAVSFITLRTVYVMC